MDLEVGKTYCKESVLHEQLMMSDYMPWNQSTFFRPTKHSL